MKCSLCAITLLGTVLGYMGSSHHPSKIGILIPILQVRELSREQSCLLKVTLLRDGKVRI